MILQEQITVGQQISWLDYYNGKMCHFRGRITSVAAPLEFGFEAEGQEECSREHVIAVLYADDLSITEESGQSVKIHHRAVHPIGGNHGE